MAQIGQSELQVGPGEVLVERKIIPAQRDRTAPYGLVVLIAFIATCVVVFFGDRLGIRETAPQPQTGTDSVPQ